MPGPNRPIRHAPFWIPRRRRKKRGPGEYNVISEATAVAMAGSAPFRDGSCSQERDVINDGSCTDTFPFTPIILSSAAEGDLAGQPLWPKHTVESVRGEVFFFNTGIAAGGNTYLPAGGAMVHMGIRKTRFDYDAVTPSFETDFDPAHEDDAEARWIWLKHFYLPPSPSAYATNSAGLLGDGSGSAWVVPFADATRARTVVTINERNKVRLGENEGLVLLVTCSPDPWAFIGPAPAARPLGLIHNHDAKVSMLPYLRTYVRQSR